MEPRGEETQKMDETREDAVLSDEERNRRMRAGIDNLLSGLLGIEPPEPPEVGARRELQEAVANESNWRTCKMVTMAIVTAEGKEVLVTSAFLRDEVPIDQMKSLENYVNEIAIPALRQDERIVIRTHDFSATFFANYCTGAFDPSDLSEHVQALQVEADAETNIRKYRECLDCHVQDCDDRIEEAPKGYVPDGSSSHTDCDHA